MKKPIKCRYCKGKIKTDKFGKKLVCKYCNNTFNIALDIERARSLLYEYPVGHIERVKFEKQYPELSNNGKKD